MAKRRKAAKEDGEEKGQEEEALALTLRLDLRTSSC